MTEAVLGHHLHDIHELVTDRDIGELVAMAAAWRSGSGKGNAAAGEGYALRFHHQSSDRYQTVLEPWWKQALADNEAAQQQVQITTF